MFLKLVIKNLLHKPLATLLSLVLLLLGTAIISLLMVTNHQLKQRFDRNLEGIDMVVGAKGSPLQLVLSAVYHLDVPTGNIKVKELDSVLSSPMIEYSIPLAYGDAYQSFRILGTDSLYVSHFGGRLHKGRLFNAPFEVLIGAHVKNITGLDIDSLFAGTHGLSRGDGHVHDSHLYRVVGVLAPSGTVLDHLIITPVKSVWEVHHHESEEEEEHGHDDEHGDEEHAKVHREHSESNKGDHHENKEQDQDITALLVKFRSPLALMTLPGAINASTAMQAAVPVLEINRLLHFLGIGITVLNMIALVIMAVSGLSVFVSLYNRMRERQYEMALMRALGSRPGFLFMSVLMEAFVLGLAGVLLGLALSRLGLWLMNLFAENDLFGGYISYGPVKEEVWLIVLGVLVSLAAALLPAIKVYRVDISKIVTHA